MWALTCHTPDTAQYLLPGAYAYGPFILLCKGCSNHEVMKVVNIQA